jgi:FkbM family methyltransferase
MIGALAPMSRLVESARESNRSLPLAVIRTAESLMRGAISPLSTPLIRLGDYEALVVADVKQPTGRMLLRYGFHDPVAWAVVHLLARGDCFIDGGANIGLMTLVGAARVGPGGRVISCEPSPSTAELLRRNLDANRFQWVTIEPAAVGQEPGRAELIEFRAGAGLHSFAPETRSTGHAVSVDVVRLDDLAAGLPGAPALVKLDVEGAELHALRGARKLLAARRTSFIVEVEPQHLERQGASVQELQELFVGYDAYAIVARDTSFELTAWQGQWDALPTTPNLVLRPRSQGSPSGESTTLLRGRSEDHRCLRGHPDEGSPGASATLPAGGARPTMRCGVRRVGRQRCWLRAGRTHRSR